MVYSWSFAVELHRRGADGCIAAVGDDCGAGFAFLQGFRRAAMVLQWAMVAMLAHSGCYAMDATQVLQPRPKVAHEWCEPHAHKRTGKARKEEKESKEMTSGDGKRKRREKERKDRRRKHFSHKISVPTSADGHSSKCSISHSTCAFHKQCQLRKNKSCQALL